MWAILYRRTLQARWGFRGVCARSDITSVPQGIRVRRSRIRRANHRGVDRLGTAEKQGRLLSTGGSYAIVLAGGSTGDDHRLSRAPRQDRLVQRKNRRRLRARVHPLRDSDDRRKDAPCGAPGLLNPRFFTLRGQIIDYRR